MSEQEQGGPLVKVARDLTEIIKLAARLEPETVNRSNARLMPGGAAMVPLGPTANAVDWLARIDEAERWHIETCDKVSHKKCTVQRAEHVEDQDDQDNEDPLTTLRFWSEDRREHYGYPLDGRTPTLVSEATFLKWALDAMWRDEPRWSDFAADVNQARRRLEDVLHAGMRQERTRVPCDRELCERKPRLIKLYGETEDDDRYKCPACKHWFDEDDYQRAYAKQLRSKGAERFVPIREAVATLETQGRSKHTVRKWLDEEGDDAPMFAWEAGGSWRRMVWWPDLWRRHCATPTRKRQAA